MIRWPRYTWGVDSSISRSVTDLVDSDKRSLEHLLGGQLDATQQVFVVAFTPNQTPESSQRTEAATRIEHTLDQAAAHAQEEGVVDDAVDDAVDTAMKEVRRR